MRIVLADDHVMIREGLRPFIERLAPEVTILEAGTFDDACAHLAGGKIDLLILDLKMPGMNGLQGIAAIKRDYPGTPCVILSAVTESEHVLEAMRLGADGFIPKSLSGAAMVSALQLVLSGERFIPSTLMQRKSAANPAAAAGSVLLGRLTPRERDILQLLREGLPNKIIATRLNVSEVTVKSHLGNVFRKLRVQNRLQAMRLLVDSEVL